MINLKIKISKYLTLQIVFVVVALLFCTSWVFLHIIDSINEENYERRKEKAMDIAKNTATVFRDNLNKIYTEDSVFATYIHKNFKRELKIDEKNTFENSNLFKKPSYEFYNYEYIIYKREKSVRELRAVYTSMPNMDLKKLNKMADVLLINEEITENIFKNQTIAKLVEIDDVLYIITYSGIFNKKSILIGALATFAPLNKQEVPSICADSEDLSSSIKIFDKYSNKIIYEKNITQRSISSNIAIKQSIAPQKAISQLNSLNMNIISNVTSRYDIITMRSILKNNFTLVIGFIMFLVIILLVSINFIEKISNKINNLFGISLLAIENNIRNKENSNSQERNKEISKILSKNDKDKFLDLLNKNKEKILEHRTSENKLTVIENNLLAIASYLDDINDKIHSNTILTKENEEYYIFQINYLLENFRLLEKISLDYNEVQKIAKSLYFNTSILSEHTTSDVNGKITILRFNIEKLYNKTIVVNNFINKLKEEVSFFEKNVSVELKNKLISLHSIQGTNKKILSSLQNIKQLFKKISIFTKSDFR